MRISNKTLILLAVGILLCCLVAGLLLMRSGAGKTQVQVTVNGTVWGTYPLNQNRRVVIGPEDGSWHNTLVIENGSAAIVESDCDNQICVHTPALQEGLVGLIVCLPHGVVVELRE